ncbi:hypothetical protein DENSPDRAFT_886972 [Dentipellis sp. KUC8613]|nr:hypothetical protein DENSPDRAFT_886972 [Dentipellis sp. KUC8613]
MCRTDYVDCLALPVSTPTTVPLCRLQWRRLAPVPPLCSPRAVSSSSPTAAVSTSVQCDAPSRTLSPRPVPLNPRCAIFAPIEAVLGPAPPPSHHVVVLRLAAPSRADRPLCAVAPLSPLSPLSRVAPLLPSSHLFCAGLAHPLAPQRCRFVAGGPAPPSPCHHKHARRRLAPLRGLAWRAPGPVPRSHALVLPPRAPTQSSRAPTAPSHGPASPHHACSRRLLCTSHLPPARAFSRTRAPSSAPSRLLARRPPPPALPPHLPPPRVPSRGPASSHHAHLRLPPRAPFPAPARAVSRPPVPCHVRPRRLPRPLASCSARSPHLAPARPISRPRTPSPGLASLLPALTPPFRAPSCTYGAPWRSHRQTPRAVAPHRAAPLTPRAPPRRLHAVSHGAARSQPPFRTFRGPCAISRPAWPSSCRVVPRRALFRYAARTAPCRALFAPNGAFPRPAPPSACPAAPSAPRLAAERPVPPSACPPRRLRAPWGRLVPGAVVCALRSQCPTSSPQQPAAPSVHPTSVSTPHCAVFAPRLAPRPVIAPPRRLVPRRPVCAPRPVVSHYTPPFSRRTERSQPRCALCKARRALLPPHGAVSHLALSSRAASCRVHAAPCRFAFHRRPAP